MCVCPQTIGLSRANLNKLENIKNITKNLKNTLTTLKRDREREGEKKTKVKTFHIHIYALHKLTTPSIHPSAKHKGFIYIEIAITITTRCKYNGSEITATTNKVLHLCSLNAKKRRTKYQLRKRSLRVCFSMTSQHVASAKLPPTSRTKRTHTNNQQIRVAKYIVIGIISLVLFITRKQLALIF